MSPFLANFLFEAANFLLLAAALGWILFKPVRRALDAEAARRAGEETERARLRADADAAAREARGARDAAEREAAETRQTALAAARAEAAAIVEDARKERARERGVLERELAASRAAEAAALAEAVGRIAAGSVQRLMAELQGPSLDLALVRAACAELAALPGGVRRPVVVESARPLGADARGLLEAVLGGGYEVRIVGELGAGVRVTSPAGQVDATPASFARQAARALADVAAAPAEGGAAPAAARGGDGA